MTRCTAGLTAATLAAGLALGGCAGENGTAPVGSRAATPQAHEAARLAGTWTIHLGRSELEDPPGDLQAEISEWKLVVPEDVSKENPVQISNDDVGEILHAASLSPGQIEFDVLSACRTYDYAIDGDRLTLTAADPTCGDEALKSILTTRPWMRARS